MSEPIYAAFPQWRGEETALLNWDDLGVVEPAGGGRAGLVGGTEPFQS